MNKHNKLLRLTALACGCAASAAAFAYTEERDGLNIDLQNKFSVGAAMRVESRDSALIGIGNGGRAYSLNKDDGDLAFDRGDIVSSVAKITSALTLSRGEYGLFVRGSFFVNDALQNRNFFNDANYCNPGAGCAKVATPAEQATKNSAVQDEAGKKVDWLDTYVYGHTDLMDHSFSFKIGRQVLNWGESTYLFNGVNSIVALNANRARVPGFELNEVFIPTPMAWASFGLLDNLSIEGFYQIAWQKTIIDASGTFFSTNDFAGIGGNRADISFGRAPENSPGYTVLRDPDRNPKHSGQFGGALRTSIPQLNDMDLAFYAMTYHSRLPLYSGISTLTPPSNPVSPLATSSARYFAEFPEDIRLYGTSFNTSLPWGVALQGEYSFKQGQPLQIDTVELLLTGLGFPTQIEPRLGATVGNKYIRGWRRHNVSQADLGATKIFGPSEYFGWEQILTLAEVGYMHVHGMEDTSALRYDGPATYTPGDAATAAGVGLPQQTEGYATSSSWGYNLMVRWTYNNVTNLFSTVEPQLRFVHDVNGISPNPVANFVEGRKQVSASVNARFLSDWSAELGYTNYFGGGGNNLFADRDFVEAILRYAF